MTPTDRPTDDRPATEAEREAERRYWAERRLTDGGVWSVGDDVVHDGEAEALGLKPAKTLHELKRDREHCVYCGEPATTDDHVPPECLFTPPLPNDLTTVPACDKCNGGASGDDEVFRNELSLSAASFGRSPAAIERAKPSWRSINRNDRFSADIRSRAIPVEAYSPEGVSLGAVWYAVPNRLDVHKRVLTRIVKGLYWHEFGERLRDDDSISLVFIDKGKPNWREGLSLVERLGPTQRQVGDGKTFRYLYGRAVDDPRFWVWLLIFFEGTGERLILAHTGDG
jgi:hypothetical protein